MPFLTYPDTHQVDSICQMLLESAFFSLSYHHFLFRQLGKLPNLSFHFHFCLLHAVVRVSSDKQNSTSHFPASDISVAPICFWNKGLISKTLHKSGPCMSHLIKHLFVACASDTMAGLRKVSSCLKAFTKIVLFVHHTLPSIFHLAYPKCFFLRESFSGSQYRSRLFVKSSQHPCNFSGFL